MLSGLILCQEKNYLGFQAEVDSKSFVLMVSSGALARWPLCNVLRRIRSLLSELEVSLLHIFREVNLAADVLATSQIGLDVVFSLERSLLNRVRSFIQLDSLSIPSVRLNPVRE